MTAGAAQTLTIWPSIVCRTERTSPRPLHCGRWSARCRAWRRRRRRSRTAGGPELDLLLGPVDRLLEGDPQVVAKVRAGLWPAAPGGRRPPPAEERVEDVREATEPARVEARRAAGRRRRRPAEHVVAPAALRVGQDLVRLVDLLEPLPGGRVVLTSGCYCRASLRNARLISASVAVALDAEDHVEVALCGGHES